MYGPGLLVLFVAGLCCSCAVSETTNKNKTAVTHCKIQPKAYLYGQLKGIAGRLGCKPSSRLTQLMPNVVIICQLLSKGLSHPDSPS